MDRKTLTGRQISQPCKAGLALSAILFMFLIPLARGQQVEDLVFTEVSETELIETLDGTQIGNWSCESGVPPTFGMGGFGGPPIGGLSVLFPSAGYTSYEFLDPLNPGYYSDILVNFGGGQDTYYEGQPLNGPFGPPWSSDPVSDYIPNPPGFAPGYGLTVYVGNGMSIPVNITVQGFQEVPESKDLLTATLLGVAGIALIGAKKQIKQWVGVKDLAQSKPS